MSMKSVLDSLWLSKLFVARSVPARYLAGAATIFTITGGLVQINALLVYHDTDVATAATEVFITVNGVPMDAGTFTITGVQGTITVSPLGAVAMVAPTLAGPLPSLLAAPGFFFSRVAGPINGLIVATFGGVGGMLVAERVSFRCIYRKIDPEASIA